MHRGEQRVGEDGGSGGGGHGTVGGAAAGGGGSASGTGESVAPGERGIRQIGREDVHAAIITDRDVRHAAGV